jgi:hypothetical protein
MTQQQVIVGSFETMAEAQQAVQLLLAHRVPRDQIGLSAQPGPANAADSQPTSAQTDANSGHFFSALFSKYDEARFRQKTVITVQTASTADSERVAHLLGDAGADEVAVNERTGDVPRRS